MASTIQALSSGSGGLVSSGDASGILQIQTGSGPTTAITVGTNQVVTLATDATINGLTVGKGGGSVSVNTVVGTSAGVNNTTGNIDAFGYNALANNTTGVANAAFGQTALQLNTTGQQNSAFGRNSLLSNSTGSYNSALGTTSLNANTTGSNNTAIGVQSLAANTTGSNNTAVGYQAGYNSIGTGNTYIGYLAGQVMTGSNCIVLGYSNSITNSGNNNIYIGYALAAGSTTSTNELILSTINVGGKGTNTGFITAGGSSGSIYQGNNSASWSTTSDQRIKENIVAIPSGLAIIGKLNPVTFDYIETKKSDTGFIAQEYQKVLPDQVTEHAASPAEKEIAGTDTLLGITPNLVPYLVKAIQELSAQVTALQAQVTALQGAK